MDPNAWAQLALRQQHYQTTDMQRGIEQLRALLGNDQSPLETANEVATIYAPGVRAQVGPLGYIYDFWELFCHAVRHVGSVPQQSERLADMLQALADLPDLYHLDGRPVIAPEGKVYWRDLPHFSYCWRDYGSRENYNYILDELDGESENSDEVDWSPRVDRLLAATTFSATFSARAQFDLGRQFDAQVALNNLLPDPYEGDEQYRPKVLSARLSVASTWIMIAGQEIYEACLTGDGTLHGRPRFADEALQVVFSSANWNTWKQQIQHLMEMLELDLESRDLARQAVVRMQSLKQDGR